MMLNKTRTTQHDFLKFYTWVRHIYNETLNIAKRQANSIHEQNYTKKFLLSQVERIKEYWNDLWRFRELFYFLTWRDIKVRYKQTALGIIWAVMRPFLTMIVFTVVFGKVAKMPSDGNAPYSIMVFAALLPWQLFANALNASSNSVISSGDLVSKIYFPRMIIPTSSIITSFVDFAISLAILIGMMAYYQFTPSITILYLPIFILLAVIIPLALD